MRLTKAEIFRFLVTGIFLIAAAVIATLTVGRDIYYGERDEGLFSFAVVNLAGSLFFLMMPVEVAFIYYLEGQINVWILILVALSTSMVAQIINYLIGLLFSRDVINRLIGKRQYVKAAERIRKYGNIIIFLFNLTPVSNDVLSLAAGMLNYRIKDAFIFTFSGLLLKYLILTLIFR